MQESNITTAVTQTNFLINNVGWGSANWKTANSSWGNLLALSASNPNSYDKQDGTLTYSTANNEFLYY